MAARQTLGRVKLVPERPDNVARARGSGGVRSPPKYGSRRSPPAPAGAAATSASKSATSRPNSARVSSVATVTFIVQTSGSQPPELEQKAASSPRGSTTGRSAKA